MPRPQLSASGGHQNSCTELQLSLSDAPGCNLRLRQCRRVSAFDATPFGDEHYPRLSICFPEHHRTDSLMRRLKHFPSWHQSTSAVMDARLKLGISRTVLFSTYSPTVTMSTCLALPSPCRPGAASLHAVPTEDCSYVMLS
jgi:hypothetical protein